MNNAILKENSVDNQNVPMYTQRAMDNKIFIFDFDGTVADTFHHNARIYDQLAHEFHLRRVSPAEHDALKDKTSKEIIQYLNVPLIKIPLLVKRAREALHADIASVEALPGLKDALLKLKSRGNTLGILTSNSSKNVKKFLQNHQLDFFGFIMTSSRLWSKSIALRRFIRKRNLSRDNIFYIGDEIRDIETARRSGVKSVGVTWGYNSQKALESHHPDFLINSPKQLHTLC